MYYKTHTSLRTVTSLCVCADSNNQPSKRLAYGAIKWFVVTCKEGLLNRIDDAAMQEILNMESYRSHQFFVEAGEPIKKTQNCFSWGGAVTLANTCSASLERDYARSVTRITLERSRIKYLLI